MTDARSSGVTSKDSAGANAGDGTVFVPPPPGSTPLVHAFAVTNSTGAALSWDDLQKDQYLSDGQWCWLHLDALNAETAAWIRRQPDIPAVAASALVAGETRPRGMIFENGVFANLRAVNLNPGSEPEDMVSLRIWADKRRCITTRRRLVKAIGDVREEVRLKGGPASPGDLFVHLANNMTQRIEPYIAAITDHIDALEEEALRAFDYRLRGRLAAVRQDAVLIRRYIAPQKEAIAALTLDKTVFSKANRIDLNELADAVTRMTEEIDASRERAIVIQDQLSDARAEEMNRNMMVLSVVAAIFLPLGFLTGLLGINVGGMPGADNAAAFWIVVVACVIIAIGLGLYFRRMKWF